MAYADYPLTEEYSIPKGTLVFPSINAANMQARAAPRRGGWRGAGCCGGVLRCCWGRCAPARPAARRLGAPLHPCTRSPRATPPPAPPPTLFSVTHTPRAPSLATPAGLPRARQV